MCLRPFNPNARAARKVICKVYNDCSKRRSGKAITSSRGQDRQVVREATCKEQKRKCSSRPRVAALFLVRSERLYATLTKTQTDHLERRFSISESITQLAEACITQQEKDSLAEALGITVHQMCVRARACACVHACVRVCA